MFAPSYLSAMVMPCALKDGKQRCSCKDIVGESKDSNELQIHKVLLHLRPRQHEQAFMEEFQTLDLLLAVLTPLILTFYMSVWGCEWLSTVFCAVLLLKGYQMQLLLLPSARRVHAHAKFRYRITLMERCLRQFIAQPLISRGPRFRAWMLTSATSNPALFPLKMLLILSGTHVTVGFSFCNPLDIVSQIFVNTIFLFIHIPPSVCQVAIATAMLVRSQPYLVWCQWCLEFICSSITTGITRTFGQTSSSINHGAASGGQQLQGFWTAGADAVALPAAPAPDLQTLAGRQVLALSMWWMLFVTWFSPLYISWRLERHFKSAYVLRSVRQQQQQQQQQPLLQEQQPPQQQQQQPEEGVKAVQLTGVFPCSCGASAGSSGEEVCSSLGRYYTPCAVLPILPRPLSRLVKHLGLAAVLCMAASELFVPLCVWSPAVTGLLSQQVIV